MFIEAPNMKLHLRASTDCSSCSINFVLYSLDTLSYKVILKQLLSYPQEFAFINCHLWIGLFKFFNFDRRCLQASKKVIMIAAYFIDCMQETLIWKSCLIFEKMYKVLTVRIFIEQYQEIVMFSFPSCIFHFSQL